MQYFIKEQNSSQGHKKEEVEEEKKKLNTKTYNVHFKKVNDNCFL